MFQLAEVDSFLLELDDDDDDDDDDDAAAAAPDVAPEELLPFPFLSLSNCFE